MRNARFRPDGTIEAGTSWRRQRHAWFLSFQALPFLETTFRLTDRLDATRGRGIANDRAFDLKLRLWQENAWRPALAVGLQDVIGTGLYGGEYIVASKRFWDVDLSLGLGWGRLGTGGDIGNPMGEVWSGFRGERSRQVGAGGTPQFRQPVPRRARGGVRRRRVEPADAALAPRRHRGAAGQARMVRRRAARRARRLSRADERPAREGGVADQSRPAMAAEPLRGCGRAFRPRHRPAAAPVASHGPGAAAGTAARGAARSWGTGRRRSGPRIFPRRCAPPASVRCRWRSRARRRGSPSRAGASRRWRRRRGGSRAPCSRICRRRWSGCGWSGGARV